jgi:hypothetical protein
MVEVVVIYNLIMYKTQPQKLIFFIFFHEQQGAPLDSSFLLTFERWAIASQV